MGRRGRRDVPVGGGVDLGATLEALAMHIGDRIGESLARALASPVQQRPSGERPVAAKAVCDHEGCERPSAAKGLCKSHYNLMLYHRRRAASAAKASKTAKATKVAKAGKAPEAGKGSRAAKSEKTSARKAGKRAPR